MSSIGLCRDVAGTWFSSGAEPSRSCARRLGRIRRTRERLAAADQNAQYEQYRKPTRRDAFLATMERIVSWSGASKRQLGAV